MIATIEYPSKHEMAESLAAQVAEWLRTAIAERGSASLAVPGGSTPALFFEALRQTELDWPRISVTLTDERCVPDTDERSNARLVREALLSGDVAAAAFLPLFGEQTLQELAMKLPLPLDAAIFGMGEDFHTASLFPGADGTAAALSPACASPLALVRPSSQPEERITLTAPPILACRHKFLILHGDTKKTALQNALDLADPAKAPVNILFQGAYPAEVHIAP